METYNERLFKGVYDVLLRKGKELSPRGLKILEVEDMAIVFPPYTRFINFESRKLNLDYIKREFLWYLKGDKYDTSIAEYAKIWKQTITPEGIIHSNYGQYIFGERNQFRYVIETLKADKDSRRASITILNESHLYVNNSDIPCTYSLNFRIRENHLNMTVHMRSQDAIFGLGSDLPSFSFIYEMVYTTLKEYYPDLEIGYYFHTADSFHIYERHFEMTKKIAKDDKYTEIECPKILNKEEVDFLIRNDFTSIPEEFKFTKWLNDFEK